MKVEFVTPKEKHQALLEMCDQYLAGLHCTLWGEPFEIISPKGRAEAATWLAEAIEGVGKVWESDRG